MYYNLLLCISESYSHKCSYLAYFTTLFEAESTSQLISTAANVKFVKSCETNKRSSSTYFCYRCQTSQIWDECLISIKWTLWGMKGIRTTWTGGSAAESGVPTGEWLGETSSGASWLWHGPSSSPVWCSYRWATSPWEHSQLCFWPKEQKT